MKKLTFLILLFTALHISVHAQKVNNPGTTFIEELQSSDYIHKPLKVDYSKTANKRWLEKPVIESQLLDGMESFDDLFFWGSEYGKFSLSSDKKVEGNYSVKTTAPTKGNKITVLGRPWAEIGPMRKFDHADWSDWNRISVWVYPEYEGHQNVSIQLKVFSGYGEEDGVYPHDIINYFLLKNNEWNHLVWEIPHMRRDRIEGFSITYRTQGHELMASDSISFYVDKLELQKVKADKTEGWDTDENIIAYSHTGYQTHAQKIAFTSNMGPTEFRILDEKGKVVFKQSSKTVQSEIGKFNVFDFSDFEKEGLYTLEAGELKTQPFAIDNNIWDRTIWKTLNFFFCERCGFAIPGSHEVCHGDLAVDHYGRKIIANGGWHDAGDLSQGVINTSEAVYSMLALAQTVKESDPKLYARLMEEAEWGAQWIMKTRFGDGYRHTWTTMDFWSDGIIGNDDDVTFYASNSAYENFIAMRAEAAAAIALKEINPSFAEHCRKAAIADWEFAVKGIRMLNIDIASEATLGAVELYKLTGEKGYLNKAIEFADFICQSQEKNSQNWTIPLSGFFYSSPDKSNILQYSHRGHDQAPIVALAELYKAMPDAPQSSEWYSTVKLYGDYIKTVAKMSAPYNMLPNGPYKNREGWMSKQITKGIKLDDNHYFRFFPVWGGLRGNSGLILSRAKGVSAAAELTGDKELFNLVRNTLQWHLGMNPLSESLMYGEGYNYSAQYTPTSGNMVGSLPVGILTNGYNDVPLYPAQNCWNYKEVWVHPSSRWLWIMSDILKADQQTTSENVK